MQKISGKFLSELSRFLYHHYRHDIANYFRQHPYQFCPIWHITISEVILQKIWGNLPIKFVPFDTSLLQTRYCKRFEAISPANLSHLTHHYCRHDIAKDFRQLPYQIWSIWCITTTDIILQKIWGNLPIKFVPFDIALLQRWYCKRFQTILQPFLKAFYQFCPKVYQ